MAESIVSDLVGRLLGSLSKSAAKEIACYFGGREKLNKIEQTMRMIQARLLDAERLREEDDGALIKSWLKRLKQVLYRLEDLFDEVSMADTEKQQLGGGKVSKPVRYLNSKFNVLTLNRKVAKSVEAIMGELEDITSDMHKLNLREVNSSSGEQHTFNLINSRQTHSFVLEEEIIGRDDDKNQIVEMLLASNHDGENVSVIPIVGIGGLGKTALAQLAYNDQSIQQNFDLKSWACISEISSFEELAGKILKSLKGTDCQQFTIEQLQSGIRECVNDKKYLLVFDDVWDEDRERWLSLRRLLYGGKRGSKIVVTSRSRVVALNMGTVEPYELRGLSEDKSWALFRSLAFRKGQEERYPNLTSIGREIVRKCANVPLAIRTIAGVLHSKDTEEEWVNFKDCAIGRIEQKENNLMSTLKLSYDHLPSQLKQCFAYCALFPEDYVFNIQNLIFLWMAQGILEPLDRNQSPEEIGYGYFMELLRRCFFQDVKRDRYDNRIAYCKMHDLMHDLALTVGDECITVDGPMDHMNDNIRHVRFIHRENSIWKPPSWFLVTSQIRTLFVTYSPSHYCVLKLNNDFSCLRCLRVLDLGWRKYESLPNSIGELKHLRYLRAQVSYLPKGITRLQNLQTLYLELSTNLRELPSGFDKLISLRHLKIGYPSDEGLIDMPPRFGELTCLQTLDRFMVGKRTGLDALAKMDLAGDLEIYYMKHRRDAISEATMANLKGKKLTCLSLNWKLLDDKEASEADDEELLGCLQPPSTLKKLEVNRWNGVRFPSWGMDVFPNLVCLLITDCRRCQYLPTFSRLPHLRTLKLHGLDALEYVEENSEISSSLSSSSALAAYFPSLETLKLRWLPELKGWSRIEHTHIDHPLHFFPRLLTLQISDCPKLMSILPLVPSLETLEIMGCEELDLLDDDAAASAWRDLNSLCFLKLGGIYKLELLPRGVGCLTMLQKLRIWGLPNLKALPEWIDQLIQLRELEISFCHELTALPESLGHLTALQQLEIRGCSELKRRCQQPDGEDWPLIQHIPSVDLW